MQFLRQMESDAVNRLLAMIPLFYGMTLVILFFLIYLPVSFSWNGAGMNLACT